jgi:hypothetical protein
MSPGLIKPTFSIIISVAPRAAWGVWRTTDHPSRNLPKQPDRPEEIRGGLASLFHSLPSQSPEK